MGITNPLKMRSVFRLCGIGVKGDFSIQIKRFFHTLCLEDFPQSLGSDSEQRRRVGEQSRPHGCYSAIAPALTQISTLAVFIVCNLGILLKISTVLQLKEMSENHSSIPILFLSAVEVYSSV